jgi:DNA-binding MarR family transcriptional regulator
VDRGEKRGLFSRAPSATDGRAVEVFLAPAGLELAERLYAQALEQLSGLIDPLAPEERRVLLGALTRS